jgi:hypothetical protein
VRKVVTALVLAMPLLLIAGQAQAVGANDNFNRPDGPIGAAWAQYNGTWVVSSNKAAVTAAGHISEATRRIRIANNYSVSADITLSPTPLRANAGLTTNYVDHNNQLFCKVEVTAEHKGGFLSIGHILGGVANSLLVYKTKVGVTNGGTYHMEVKRSGPKVTCTVSGGGLAAPSKVTYSVPKAEGRVLSKGRRAGLRARWESDENDGGSRWDNFVAVALA